MRTKLYKTFGSAATACTLEAVFVDGTEVQAFALRSDLLDSGNATVAERSFAWIPNEKRTLRVFQLPSGDFGFRAFGSGVSDEPIALSVFGEESKALSHLDEVARSYIDSDKGWAEL